MPANFDLLLTRLPPTEILIHQIQIVSLLKLLTKITTVEVILQKILMENNTSGKLVLGAWCGFTSEANNTTIITDSTSDTHKTEVSHPIKENQTMEILHESGNSSNRGSNYDNPSMENSTWIPVSQTDKCPTDKSICTTAMVTLTIPPSIKFIPVGLPGHITPLSDSLWIQFC